MVLNVAAYKTYTVSCCEEKTLGNEVLRKIYGAKNKK
jgi:hypothetical protein